MKLRNKKTGEIKEYGTVGATTFGKGGVLEAFAVYESLAELNKEWEDYEEPKEYWFVDSGGEVEEATYLTENDKANLANFGNYFETKEEAEQVLEKLRTWKWLKDNGVSLKYDKDNFVLHIVVSTSMSPNQWRTGGYIQKLDLLFGGEE